jgi:hypothetical protein
MACTRLEQDTEGIFGPNGKEVVSCIVMSLAAWGRLSL